MSGAAPLRGVVVSVRGTVVDARFETALPSIGAAIVCQSDALAYIAYQRLLEMGHKVPKDV